MIISSHQILRREHIRPVRCLLFDVGYTLWDRRRDKQAGEQVEQEADRQTGALLSRWNLSERTSAGDDAALGAHFRAVFDEYEHVLLKQHIGIEPDGPYLVQQSLAHWGYERIDVHMARAIFQSLQIHIASPSFLFEDTISTLTTLQGRGFLLGVVTNRLWGGSDFLADLRQLGLLAYFDPRAIAISADVGVRKPHPDLFLHACRTLGIAPSEAAMVGDSLRTDILGAQRLGMVTVWKPRPRQLEPIKATSTRQGYASVPLSQGPLQAHTHVDNDHADIDTDYLPASSEGRDGYLERYLRGEIVPDVVIEHVSDLLDIFVAAHVTL